MSLLWESHALPYLDRGAAVEAKRLRLPVLQVDLQDIWHEEQRIVLHRVLERRELISHFHSEPSPSL